jgi:hypothetical protein
MGKTVHVYPFHSGWAVQREGKAGAVYSTKKDAVEKARSLVRGLAVGQIVVHGKDGRILSRTTRGLPKVQQPPRKSGLGTKRIQKAVWEVVRDRLATIKS